MMVKKFSSPREESLEIAIQIRRAILEDKIYSDSVLRDCLVIATNLNKKDDIKWIISELSGYKSSDIIPSYRNISCPLFDDIERFKGYQNMTMAFDVHYYVVFLEQKTDESESL